MPGLSTHIITSLQKNQSPSLTQSWQPHPTRVGQQENTHPMAFKHQWNTHIGTSEKIIIKKIHPGIAKPFRWKYSKIVLHGQVLLLLLQDENKLCEAHLTPFERSCWTRSQSSCAPFDLAANGRRLLCLPADRCVCTKL